MGNATAEIATAEDSFRLTRSPAVNAAVLYALAWHWQPWSVSSDRRGERGREGRISGLNVATAKREPRNQEVITDPGVYIPPVNGVCIMCLAVVGESSPDWRVFRAAGRPPQLVILEAGRTE